MIEMSYNYFMLLILEPTTEASKVSNIFGIRSMAVGSNKARQSFGHAFRINYAVLYAVFNKFRYHFKI